MNTRTPMALAILLLLANPIAAGLLAQTLTTIAGEDFDGGAVGLISGFDPLTENRDGGPGDFYGVASLGSWPQGFPPGIPFSLVDDTVASVSNPANPPFPNDREGVYGMNADMDNRFFALSDLREWTDVEGPLAAAWTFDVSGSGNEPLFLKIDLGQQSDGSSFGGIAAGNLLIEYSLDGGPFQTAFSCDPADATGSGFAYRAMDSGALPTTASVLRATGPTAPLKLSAETGVAAGDTFLDKAPSAGAGAGKLDTFLVPLSGNGAELTIRITALLPFEAMAFDNLALCVETPDFILGDANGDGSFDFGDIDPFLLALVDPEAYALLYPDIDPDQVLDFDGDGFVNFGDIDGFLDALVNG